MSKKRLIVSIVSTVLALSLLLGAVLAVVLTQQGDVVDENNNPHVESLNGEQPNKNEGEGDQAESNNGSSSVETKDPDPDFDEGNEDLLDASVIAKLSVMERGEPLTDNQGNYTLGSDGSILYEGGDEEAIYTILDALILLVNHAANNGYTTEANHQLQRLYFEYYELFNAMSLEDRHAKLTACVPATGAVATELSLAAETVLGFTRPDGFSFVFEGQIPSETKIQFCHVKPIACNLQANEGLCMYAELQALCGEDTKRNLEMWLHNIVKVVKEAGLSDQHARLAQLLYAYSLANSNYTANWGACLIECISMEQLTFLSLKEAVNAQFGADIAGNTALLSYLETEWDGGVA